MKDIIYPDPVIIGGVGGSGTRLIAECLQYLGYFMGNDLNEASDNLLFTLLFKRIEVLTETDSEFKKLIDVFLEITFNNEEIPPQTIDFIKNLTVKPRKQHPKKWLEERIDQVTRERKVAHKNGPWGWKEPNTHVVIERINNNFSGMKYIHVMRNGLDMAFSNNQNQLNLWGANFIGEELEINPRYSLKYWCKVHKRINQIGKVIGENFLLLNYDAFCKDPNKGVKKLCEFLGKEFDSTLVDKVSAPKSIGRFKSFNAEMFDSEDINYVKELGFDNKFDR
jgi:hypothetical protein